MTALECPYGQKNCPGGAACTCALPSNLRLYRHTTTAMIHDANGPWVSAHDVLAELDRLNKQVGELQALKSAFAHDAAMLGARAAAAEAEIRRVTPIVQSAGGTLREALRKVCEHSARGSVVYQFAAGALTDSHPETTPPRSFQDRVFDWARDCFGEHDTASREMRTYRFLEEALELAQACGCTEEAAARVLSYVYGRPSGEVAQETGGTMVSLAVLCQAFGIGMNRCAEVELTRVLGKVEHIRARHAAKPDFGSSPKTRPEGGPL